MTQNKKTASPTGPRVALVLPDMHVPFEHKRAVNAFYELGNYLGVSEVIQLGDRADFYAINSHGKDPRIRVFLDREIAALQKSVQAQARAFPAETKHVQLEGNHEYRFFRYVANNAPELYNLLDYKKILDFPKDWTWVPYTGEQKYRMLNANGVCRHEPLSGSSAKASLAQAMSTHFYGHNHRVQYAEHKPMLGPKLYAASFGFLGNLNAPVFNFVKKPKQWAIGAGLVWAIGNVIVKVEQLEYRNGHVLYAGKSFS